MQCMTFNPSDSLQLSGMTLRARGRRSSKEASSTTDWISGYDITAQLAVTGNREIDKMKITGWSESERYVVPTNRKLAFTKLV